MLFLTYGTMLKEKAIVGQKTASQKIQCSQNLYVQFKTAAHKTPQEQKACKLLKTHWHCRQLSERTPVFQVNENQNEYTLHLSECLRPKVKVKDMLARMWSKQNTPPLLEGMQTLQTLQKTIWQLFRKLGIYLSLDPDIALVGIHLNDA